MLKYGARGEERRDGSSFVGNGILVILTEHARCEIYCFVIWVPRLMFETHTHRAIYRPRFGIREPNKDDGVS